MPEKDTSLAIENAVQQLEQAPDILPEKFKSLRIGLRNISMSLRDIDGQEYEPEVAEWLRQVKEIAYETQDVIGSVVADTNLRKEKSKFGRLLSGRWVIERRVNDIDNIEKRIQNIQPSTGSIKDSHHGHISSKINEVVGFNDAKETLVRQLISEATSQSKAILIFGKAGSGKTTLAKLICNDARIIKHFGHPYWVHFPRDFSLEELSQKIYKQTEELKAEHTDGEGTENLIVIDSMSNSQVWNDLMSTYPHKLNGSRIVLTSRLTPAEIRMNQKNSYEIKPLDTTQSWNLLSRKVFEGGRCPSDLENLGKRMVDKCKGSPRAIVTLAAILDCAEKTEEMWTLILKDYRDLSIYHDLPKDQQLCLLYFGLFPIGFDIPAKQIIQMYQAEGILKQRGSKRAEEIGDDYLEELNRKSMIQIGQRSTDGSVKICRVSNHVSHHCISRGAAEEFFEVRKNSNFKPQKHIKRLAIHSDSVRDVFKSSGNCSHIHSLHCFGKNNVSTSILSTDFWRTLLHNFPHLKVLNLSNIDLDRVPKELGKLVQLRYLKARASNVTYLPSSIGNLRYLETLDMRGSHVLLGIPHSIWKIKSLRHLYLGGSSSLPNTRGVDYYKALLSLQTLSGVSPNKELKWLMVRAKFPNVTTLRICSLDSEVTFKFLNSLDHLYHLKSLRVEMPTSLPDSNAFPSSLTKLTLFKTRLNRSSFKTLEKLSNLRVLKLLKEALFGEEIECSSGGFLQLEVMCIANLVLRKWTIGKGSMRCLKNLVIKNCAITWETIPEDLRHAATFTAREEEENQ